MNELFRISNLESSTGTEIEGFHALLVGKEDRPDSWWITQPFEKLWRGKTSGWLDQLKKWHSWAFSGNPILKLYSVPCCVIIGNPTLLTANPIYSYKVPINRLSCWRSSIRMKWNSQSIKIGSYSSRAKSRIQKLRDHRGISLRGQS